jgi:hypothetical protein
MGLPMAHNYIKHTKIDLKSHPDFTEKWVQGIIAEDPSILGLGDLVLKDIEKIQPGAGRLDLLFQDSETNLRFEVEIQLGKTDESHIIRTIEYWDIERKRYPQYDHIAVLVAEDITSRFLNIISLFNGVIPLVAIQLNAITIGDQVTLVFTTVLDQRPGFALEEEEDQEATDRTYWEKRGSKSTVAMSDEVLTMLKGIDRGLELKYNKFYIGLAKDGKPFNFIVLRPKKNALRVEPRITRSEVIENNMDTAGLDVLEYSVRDKRYRIRLSKADLTKNADLLQSLFSQAYQEFTGSSMSD